MAWHCMFLAACHSMPAQYSPESLNFAELHVNIMTSINALIRVVSGNTHDYRVSATQEGTLVLSLLLLPLATDISPYVPSSS